MRQLESAKCGLNALVSASTWDDPDANGVHRKYRVSICQHGIWENAVQLNFQKGPWKDRVVNGMVHPAQPNGITDEVLLAVVADRLKEFPGDAPAEARSLVLKAMAILDGIPR